MIRKMIATWFGFDREIAELQQKVHELGWDDCFGVYTRAAFHQMCATQPRGGRILVFLDFDRIHELNQLLSYDEVNRRIKQLFQEGLRKSDLVGRHFSGDEITILLDTDEIDAGKAVMSKLEARATALGLSFTHALDAWQTHEDLDLAANRLAQSVMCLKAPTRAA